MGRTIRRVALGEARRIAEPRWVEEGMSFVDARIDVADLNASSRVRPAASDSPSIGRIDDLMALTQNWVVECVVLDTLHHRRAFDCIQRCPVELDRDRVERNIVLTSYFRLGRVGVEPLFEIVALRRELGAI